MHWEFYRQCRWLTEVILRLSQRVRPLTQRSRVRERLLLGFCGLAVATNLAACSSPGSDLPVLSPLADTAAYRLGPGDEVSLKVLGANELNGDYPVQPDGTIRLLMLGAIPAAGSNPETLEHRISGALKTGGFIKQPQVSVSIVKYRPFYILGEVVKPGGYPYASGMRVLSAVAAAEGYTYRANEKYVIITRNGKASRADVLSSILPGDIIEVPERYL